MLTMELWNNGTMEQWNSGTNFRIFVLNFIQSK